MATSTPLGAAPPLQPQPSMRHRVLFQRLHPEATLPRSWSDHAVGLDLHACLITPQGRPNNLILPPRQSRLVPSGLSAEPPPGFYLAVFSRLGLAKRSIFVPDSPAILDPDSRSEINVLLYNGGLDSQYIQHGDRVAQLVLLPHLETEAIWSPP